MHATRFEYKFRFWIHGLIYLLGFFALPVIANTTPGLADVLHLTTKSTWLVLSSLLARLGILGFGAATVVLLLVAALFAGLGAALRTWGAAYVGSSVVQSSSMHGAVLLADGPYRRTRNPLYLGTLLHTVGIALLMPPAGAIFCIAAIWLFQVRLALAEEPYLTAQFGQAYIDYQRAVPRFLPSLRPLIPAAGQHAHWLQAALGELYVLGVFVTLVGFGWDFNAQPLQQGILISLGVALVVRAFLPRDIAQATQPI